MTISIPTVKLPRFESFEEYLAYDDPSDRLYELFNGELVELAPESGSNVAIATMLLVYFAQMLGHRRVRGHGLELEVRGEPRNRYPDLTIIKAEHVESLRSRNTLRFDLAPPDLVVEVVSPGDLQRDSPEERLRQRDYIAKRNQYQDREIPCYWIIDPQVQAITVLTLTDRQYEERVYRDSERLTFQDSPLDLTAAELLAAGDT